MSEKIYTFWEGKLPEYIKLCMETWDFPFIILNYENLNQYTSPIPEKVKQLSLPKVADYVRVHVLRDNGGYWLDADTIMFTALPAEIILGDNKTRDNSIGYLHTEPNTNMFIEWAKFQDDIIEKLPKMVKDTTRWDIMGNLFTDGYLKKHTEINIGLREARFAERFIIKDNSSGMNKYKTFYFGNKFTLKDVFVNSMIKYNKEPDMLMLHNSWTPDWYKKLSKEDVLKQNCTLSNILRELINE